MSTSTDPTPADSRPAFIPLEANPQLMTTLIHKLGVSSALEMHDVYSLTDPELLAFIPRPALALLLVFPVSAVYESQRMAEDSLVENYHGKGDAEAVLWWPQTIRNACGLMGLLHAVTNGQARSFIGGCIMLGGVATTDFIQSMALHLTTLSRRAFPSPPMAELVSSNKPPNSPRPTKKPPHKATRPPRPPKTTSSYTTFASPKATTVPCGSWTVDERGLSGGVTWMRMRMS